MARPWTDNKKTTLGRGPLPFSYGTCLNCWAGLRPMGQMFFISVSYNLLACDWHVTLRIMFLQSSVFALSMADTASFEVM